MSYITTHVLDTSRGRPAAGVGVVLEKRGSLGEWREIGRGETDADGRLRSLGGEAPQPGVYRLIFDTGRYFDVQGVRGFYPEAVIVFQTADGEGHYHVPLLLNPFGYSTYRGS
jgi:5-hydroxyisourate hydrolase